MDIYTPAADGRARPVLFWIHGGACYIGSGNDHDGSVLAARATWWWLQSTIPIRWMDGTVPATGGLTLAILRFLR